MYRIVLLRIWNDGHILFQQDSYWKSWTLSTENAAIAQLQRASHHH